MKKVILVAIFILIYTNIYAQPSMGGGNRGGRPQGGPKGERPLMQNDRQNQDGFMIMGLPDIPNLTLEQREKLSKEITNERKDISKLMQEKQTLKTDTQNPGMAEKERQKLFEKMAKIDDKIQQKEEKYKKKYRSILSEEQYNTFIESKKDIQFRGQNRNDRKPDREGMKQPSQMRPDDNSEHPDMPLDDMF